MLHFLLLRIFNDSVTYLDMTVLIHNLAFGAGSTKCIGQHLADEEMIKTLAFLDIIKIYKAACEPMLTVAPVDDYLSDLANTPVTILLSKFRSILNGSS